MPSGSLWAVRISTQLDTFWRCTKDLSAKLMINRTGGMKPGWLCSVNFQAKTHFGKSLYADFHPTESRLSCWVKVNTLWIHFNSKNIFKSVATVRYKLLLHITTSRYLPTLVLPLLPAFQSWPILSLMMKFIVLIIYFPLLRNKQMTQSSTLKSLQSTETAI